MRDQRSKQGRRWEKNFPSQQGETSKRQKYVRKRGRKGISKVIALKSWPSDHPVLFDGTVFLEGSAS